MENLFVTPIKVTLLDCNDHDRSRGVRLSHTPVELEPLGARGLGDLQFVGLCERVLALREIKERGEKKY